MDHLDAVDDVLQLAAQRPVVPVAERLEVDLVEVGPGADVLEDLSGGVAVGSVTSAKPARPRALENLDRPLGRNKGFVVRGGDHGGALSLRDVDQLLWRDVHGLRERTRVAQRLRGDPVLAIRAVQVTAEHAEGERIGAWKRVKERLLFDRIALKGTDVPPWHHQHAATVVSDLADPA